MQASRTEPVATDLLGDVRFLRAFIRACSTKARLRMGKRTTIRPGLAFGDSVPPAPASTLERLRAFQERWKGRTGREEQLSQPFLTELCQALGVAAPGTDVGYQFEHRVHVPGRASSGKLDLYRAGHFILESKCGRNDPSETGSAPIRGKKAYWAYIERAYREQALVYASLLPAGPPPLLIVLDVAHRFWIWRQFDGRFDGFHSPHRIEIPFDEIANEDNARILLACWEDPDRLDRSKHQELITREAVESLAKLATDLEAAMPEEGAAERIARFLMRCLFCMFAEDVELLHRGLFAKLLAKASKAPQLFPMEVGRLFGEMNTGGVYDFERVRHFNGDLFKEANALPLTAEQLDLLSEAASRDWSEVDPAIFGTLLERALDPTERRRLGAHFTPRRYVERVVRSAIEEPLRHDWEIIQVQAAELLGDLEDPSPQVRREVGKLYRGFLSHLRQVRVLDPACGTGNFLYVSYALLKGLEHEVLEALRVLDLGAQEGLDILGERVVPEQMLGIEIKPWATEIAQLVLWIGHLQWELQHRAHETLPEPLLPTQRTIECRDALIEWDRTVPRVDAEGNPLSRWDGYTMGVHPSTGNEVPDERAQVPILDYEGVRQAQWPAADYIVGNPPFVGNTRMRATLGDAYVDALSQAYEKELPRRIDLVTYWWHRAAKEVRQGSVKRLGLITTNSIRQSENRKVMETHLKGQPPLGLVMAVPDHPWVDDGADVRVAMTVAERVTPGDARLARLLEVATERGTHLELRERVVRNIHADLRAGADTTSAQALLANKNVSFQGVQVAGRGFIVNADQVQQLGYDVDHLPPVIRPYLGGKELVDKWRGRFVIDCYGYSEEALKREHPSVYQWLYDHVKPERDHNRRKSRRERWWLFGETRPGMRDALAPLDHFIATPETASHRLFERLPSTVCPNHGIYVIALEDSTSLGVLSSRAHVLWSLRLGGRLGVGNDPRYNNTRCFLTFPFPTASDPQRGAIGAAAEAIERHLKSCRDQTPHVTLTAMYNVLEKRRADAPLSEKERHLHVLIATDVLIDLHDRLDSAVLSAYGVPESIDDESLLAFLVELNRERAEEELSGMVRWLRPDLATTEQRATIASTKAKPKRIDAVDWPSDPFDQMAAVMAASRVRQGDFSVEEVAASFKRAPRKSVEKYLAALAKQHLLSRSDDGRFRSTTVAA